MKKVEPITIKDDGAEVFHLAATTANADWLRAARLARRADAGDKEAAEALARLEAMPMVRVEDQDREGGPGNV